jgi:AcrR family transcriptional regulator
MTLAKPIKKHKIRQSPKLPADKRREQLMRAAQTLFARKGYRSTTTEEIARKAGLTKGALYFHFSNKEDVLFELIKTIGEHGDAMFDEQMPEKISPVGLFDLLRERHQGCGGLDHQDAIDIWIQGLRIPRIKKHISRRFRERRAKLAEMLDPSFGRSSKQRSEIVMMIVALYHGLAAEAMVHGSKVDIDAQMQLLKQLFAGQIGEKKGTRK